MSLIICPECGKQISDKANQCVNCGFPIGEQKTNLESNNKLYSLLLTDCSKNRIKAIQIVREIMNCDLDTAKSLTVGSSAIVSKKLNIDEAKKIQKRFFDIGVNAEIIEDNSTINVQYDTIRCPRCGSTAITTGQRGFTIMTGFWGSNKTVNRCGKCGYTWQPK